MARVSIQGTHTCADTITVGLFPCFLSETLSFQLHTNNNEKIHYKHEASAGIVILPSSKTHQSAALASPASARASERARTFLPPHPRPPARATQRHLPDLPLLRFSTRSASASDAWDRGPVAKAQSGYHQRRAVCETDAMAGLLVSLRYSESNGAAQSGPHDAVTRLELVERSADKTGTREQDKGADIGCYGRSDKTGGDTHSSCADSRHADTMESHQVHSSFLCHGRRAARGALDIGKDHQADSRLLPDSASAAAGGSASRRHRSRGAKSRSGVV